MDARSWRVEWYLNILSPIRLICWLNVWMRLPGRIMYYFGFLGTFSVLSWSSASIFCNAIYVFSDSLSVLVVDTRWIDVELALFLLVLISSFTGFIEYVSRLSFFQLYVVGCLSFCKIDKTRDRFSTFHGGDDLLLFVFFPEKYLMHELSMAQVAGCLPI